MTTANVKVSIMVSMQSSGLILMLKQSDGTRRTHAKSLVSKLFSGMFSVVLTVAKTNALPPMQRRILLWWKFSIPTAVSLCLCLETPAPDSANIIINDRYVVTKAMSIMIEPTTAKPVLQPL